MALETIKKFGLEIIIDDTLTLRVNSNPAIYIQCFPEQPKYFIYTAHAPSSGGYCSSNINAIKVIESLIDQYCMKWVSVGQDNYAHIITNQTIRVGNTPTWIWSANTEDYISTSHLYPVLSWET